MKVPPKRKGNSPHECAYVQTRARLNESPSEKEGKLAGVVLRAGGVAGASMKVPPKRKGNRRQGQTQTSSQEEPQ